MRACMQFVYGQSCQMALLFQFGMLQLTNTCYQKNCKKEVVSFFAQFTCHGRLKEGLAFNRNCKKKSGNSVYGACVCMYYVVLAVQIVGQTGCFSSSFLRLLRSR